MSASVIRKPSAEEVKIAMDLWALTRAMFIQCPTSLPVIKDNIVLRRYMPHTLFNDFLFCGDVRVPQFFHALNDFRTEEQKTYWVYLDEYWNPPPVAMNINQLIETLASSPDARGNIARGLMWTLTRTRPVYKMSKSLLEWLAESHPNYRIPDDSQFRKKGWVILECVN
jgi:hypothetical protein